MTHLAAHETNPFSAPWQDDPSADQRPAADVSVEAMTRLRSPFDTEDPDREAGHRQPQG